MPTPRRVNAIMAELVRKHAPLSPLHKETAESPRPYAVPQTARAGKRPKEQAAAADNCAELAPAASRARGIVCACCRSCLCVGGYFYVTGGQIMSTDDAYVQAERVGISTDVSGIVQDVEVKDNQHVEAGQVLYRLDPRQFQIALDNAKANLAQIAIVHRRDEAGLSAHAERRRRSAGASRPRSEQL